MKPQDILDRINRENLLQSVIDEEKQKIRNTINNNLCLTKDPTKDTYVCFNEFDADERLLDFVFDEYKEKGWLLEVKKLPKPIKATVLCLKFSEEVKQQYIDKYNELAKVKI